MKSIVSRTVEEMFRGVGSVRATILLGWRRCDTNVEAITVLQNRVPNAQLGLCHGFGGRRQPTHFNEIG